ncbi:hypothetical protein RR48_14865 [Papilio machaon]|uniref:Uncharacterized protein n=1 Tax=Papilio machaon TaxID=76193 RepID=A0A194R5T2_PAPMA|nr:hypothetical protein RR48_14865 [Papilio machaon]
MAAVFWTGAEVETRSKDNDEQTMIGGAIWTQIVVTIGLIISTVVDDHIQPFVEGYFLFSAMALLIVTGVILITIEFKKMRRRQQTASSAQDSSAERSSPHHARRNTFDRTYLAIGALCLLSVPLELFKNPRNVLKNLDFIAGNLKGNNKHFHNLVSYMVSILITGLLAFGAYWTTKYLMSMPDPHSSPVTPSPTVPEPGAWKI